MVAISFVGLSLPEAVLAQTPPGAGEGAPALPAAATCQAALEAELEAWDVTGEVFPDVSDPLGGATWRLPTRRPGVWVVVTMDSRNHPALVRIDARETRRLDFDASCRTEQRVQAAPQVPSEADAFDDDALVALLNRQRAGVIYVWSPHMPLSVDAHEHIARAARELGVAMTAVLDPNAGIGYARETALSAGLPAEALRPFRSVELAFRNATLHAPSLVIYKDGRIVGLAIPGYRDEAGYEALLRSRLEER